MLQNVALVISTIRLGKNNDLLECERILLIRHLLSCNEVKESCTLFSRLPKIERLIDLIVVVIVNLKLDY